MSKLGHFSAIPILLVTVYVPIYVRSSLLWVGNRKCTDFIPSHSHQAIPVLFPIPTELD